MIYLLQGEMIMKLFIGCSSTNNIPDKYLKDCSNYLDELLRENDIVFGGCSTGLMGLAYNITKEYNNKVIGISPTIFKSDLDILDCDEKIITDNTSCRTEELINNSDALIFLPGGIGTIYELFTAIELKRNHEFNKPIVLYNSNQYFTKLLNFLSTMYEEGFADCNIKSYYHVSDSVADTIKYLNK